jgi:hypothetical protein
MTASRIPLSDYVESADDHCFELTTHGHIRLGVYGQIAKLIDQAGDAAERGDAHRVAALCKEILARVRSEFRGGRALQ